MERLEQPESDDSVLETLEVRVAAIILPMPAETSSRMVRARAGNGNVARDSLASSGRRNREGTTVGKALRAEALSELRRKHPARSLTQKVRPGWRMGLQSGGGATGCW